MTQGGPAIASNRDLATVPNPDAKRKPWASHGRGVTTYTEPKEASVKLNRAQSDVVGHMYDRRQLGPDRDILLKAARQFQRCHEAAGYCLRSSGDIREYVDGGLGPQVPLTDARQKAVKQFADWRIVIVDVWGITGWRILNAVLVDQDTILRASLRFHQDSSQATVKFTTRIFRECLQTLAKTMGFG